MWNWLYKVFAAPYGGREIIAQAEQNAEFLKRLEGLQ